MKKSLARLKIFTWHIHGSYLFYLSQGDFDIYIPVNKERSEGYYGRGETFPFENNVIEIAAQDVKYLQFDCVLFQTNANYLVDQYEILSPEQRNLPKVYLEHDPPRIHPTDTRHVMNDPRVLFVHVTHFNRLMWDNNNLSSKVVEHGVLIPEFPYLGDLERGVVVINNLPARGRLLGLDIFNEVKKHIPLDLVGMGSEELGLGEVLHPQLPAFLSHYRFFFNPIRYTSLGLAVCEAMMSGMPVVGMATTELVTVINHGVNGFIHTDISVLIAEMKTLLSDKSLAEQIGSKGRQTALERFNIQRFIADWKAVFHQAIEQNVTTHSLTEPIPHQHLM